MSFGGVDEAKLVRAAAEQLGPMLEKVRVELLQDIVTVINNLLDQRQATITFDRKESK
jgi:hypothetical protein